MNAQYNETLLEVSPLARICLILNKSYIVMSIIPAKTARDTSQYNVWKASGKTNIIIKLNKDISPAPKTSEIPAIRTPFIFLAKKLINDMSPKISVVIPNAPASSHQSIKIMKLDNIMPIVTAYKTIGITNNIVLAL